MDRGVVVGTGGGEVSGPVVAAARAPLDVVQLQPARRPAAGHVEPARKQQQPRLVDVERRAALPERAELAVDRPPVLDIHAVARRARDPTHHLVCAHVDARTFEHGPLLVGELHLYHDIFDVTVASGARERTLDRDLDLAPRFFAPRVARRI
jgi:hypothetical protein